MQRADVAMYQAKGSENRVVGYSSEGDDNSLARLDDGRRAAARDRARRDRASHYQPQVEAPAGDDRGRGARALDDERGAACRRTSSSRSPSRPV